MNNDLTLPRRAWISVLLCVCVSLGTVLGMHPLPAQAQTLPYNVAIADTQPSAPDDNGATPQFVGESLGMAKGQAWTTGGGYLYWAYCYVPGPSSVEMPDAPAAGGYLRRWSVGGSSMTYLNSDNFCQTEHWAANENGLFYWNRDDKTIYRYGFGEGSDPVKIFGPTFDEPRGALVLDGGFVYYLMHNGIQGSSIYRKPQKGSVNEGSYITEAGDTNTVNAHSLVATSDYFYWHAEGKLWRMGKACLSACKASIATESVARLNNAQGGRLLSTSTEPFWLTPDGATMRAYRCSLSAITPGCAVTNQRTASVTPAAPVAGNTYASFISDMATDGTFLFWIENVKSCTTTGFFICSATTDGRLMKWRIWTGLQVIGAPPLPFSTPEPIATLNSGGVTFYMGNYLMGVPNQTVSEKVTYADGNVYFYTSRGLARIRADAPPIRWDLTADSYEVTQGIQSLHNDVPLIAKKPTYVRLYSRKLDGPNANAVNAVLYGTRNGVPLPDSPLYPINGRLPINQNAFPDRTQINSGWLFKLPDSWVIEGNISLQPSVNPEQTYRETNMQNNVYPARSYNFQRKVPICTIFVPIRTEAPAASTSNPNFWNMVERFKTLLPVSDIWTYRQTNDIAEFEVRFWGPFPYPAFGPYELWDNSFPADKDKVMVSLIERDMFSDDPDECDAVNAPTHLVGMVHPDTNAGNLNGYANYWIDTSFVRLPFHDSRGLADQWNKPTSGSTMAQELTHNYNGVTGSRWKHVNCGNPDGLNGAYPYNPCWLDDKAYDNAATHFGFDPLTLQIIPPRSAGDYMSYAGGKWVSDYTWKGMIDELNNTLANSVERRNQPQSASTPNGVIVVSGVVSPAIQQGELNPAWVIENPAMQQSLLRKVDAMNARIAQLHMQAHDGKNLDGHDHAHGDTAHYTVRLLSANGTVLGSQAIVASTGSHGGGTAYSFLDALPIPANSVVAKLDVMAEDNTIVMSRNVSPHAPAITLLTPSGGETVNDSMTLSWQASDADAGDKLYYTLQYSADNGQTWQAIFTGLPHPIDPATNAPMTTVTMGLSKLENLPGGSQARLRLLVSDGYNTAIALSQAFAVNNRAPQPNIVSPSAYSQFEAGSMILLKGNAMDAEEGGLSGAALAWSVDGVPVGTGTDTIVTNLAPGSHIAELKATDGAGNTGAMTTTLTVAPLSVPQTANAFVLDGDCNDAGYTNAKHIALAAYADGSRADVQLMRSTDKLMVCFSGLKKASGSAPISFATLRMDLNASQDTSTQADDVEVLMTESGEIKSHVGTGSAWAPQGPTALNGRVRNENSADGLWNAELQLDISIFGGWNKAVGIMFDHNWVTAVADDKFYPLGAVWNKPNTWATVLLGELPRLVSLDAAAAYAGDGDQVIVLSGSNFASNAQAFWNGETRPTTYISSTQVSMTVLAADVATVGTARVQVANGSALGVAGSNVLPFGINAKPQPIAPNKNLKVFIPFAIR